MAEMSDDLDERVRLIGLALARHPREPGLLFTLADTEKRRHAPAAALAATDRLLALAPDHAGGWYVRGWALRLLGDAAGAIAALRRTLDLGPDRAEARVLLGDALLLAGDYAAGFPLVEARFDAYPAYQEVARVLGPWRWRPGMDVAGKRVLVYGEQGLGDCIQHLRFLPLLRAAGVADLSLAVFPKLWRLFEPFRAVADFRETAALGQDVDIVMPLASLAAWCGVTRDTIPAADGYLRPEPERVAAWRDRHGADPRPRIGLNWQGNPVGTIDRGRSLPLAAFAPLLVRTDLRCIALQKNAGVEQIGPDMALERPDLDTGPDAFIDTAALMATLDLVVTSDTAVAHLAGALGVPALVLLKRVPDWRWGLAGGVTPWYRSLRLLRQTADGDWDGVLDQVTDALAQPRHAPLETAGSGAISPDIP